MAFILNRPPQRGLPKATISDKALLARICASLNWDVAVKDADIDVIVKDGAVTLLGTARTFRDKWAVERSARRAGARRIANEMLVLPDV